MPILYNHLLLPDIHIPYWANIQYYFHHLVFESLFNIIYTVYRSFATEIVNNMCKFTRINVIIKDGRVFLIDYLGTFDKLIT